MSPPIKSTPLNASIEAPQTFSIHSNAASKPSKKVARIGQQFLNAQSNSASSMLDEVTSELDPPAKVTNRSSLRRVGSIDSFNQLLSAAANSASLMLDEKTSESYPPAKVTNRSSLKRVGSIDSFKQLLSAAENSASTMLDEENPVIAANSSHNMIDTQEDSPRSVTEFYSRLQPVHDPLMVLAMAAASSAPSRPAQPKFKIILTNPWGLEEDISCRVAQIAGIQVARGNRSMEELLYNREVQKQTG